MTENKRFELKLCSNGTYYVYENGTLTDIDFDKFNKESADALIDEVNALYDENEQLKQQSTMYHNLFLELQKQLKDVKRASDLDSKDFDDLIELSKGNVFDEELGWIHLPIKELKE